MDNKTFIDYLNKYTEWQYINRLPVVIEIKADTPDCEHCEEYNSKCHLEYIRYTNEKGQSCWRSKCVRENVWEDTPLNELFEKFNPEE